MSTREENGVANEAIVLEWVVSSTLLDFKAVKKQWAGALLSVECCCFVQRPCIWRASRNFELACLKMKMNERKYFGHLVTFWFSIFRMSFSPLGVMLVMKILEDKWYLLLSYYIACTSTTYGVGLGELCLNLPVLLCQQFLEM